MEVLYAQCKSFKLTCLNQIQSDNQVLYRKQTIPFEPRIKFIEFTYQLRQLSNIMSLQPTPLLFPILKHTLKQVNALTKTFTNLKSSFLKSHKNISPAQAPAFTITDRLIQHVDNINALSAAELSLNKQPKYKSAMSIIKPNSLSSHQQTNLAQNLLIQIANLIQVGSHYDEPLPTSNLTPNSVFVFLLEQTLFVTKLKFQFCTFLTKVDFRLGRVKENVQTAIVETVRTCDNHVRRFMNVWALLAEKDQDYKTYEYMIKLSQEFKNHLMRVVAAFYQLIYNLTEPEPSTFTNFILLSNLLVKSQIQKLQLSQKQYQKLVHQQSQRKSFWPFYKNSSLKQNNLTNISQQVSRSMIKKNKAQEESVNMNHVSFESIDDKNNKKKSSDKRQNLLKSNQNHQQTKGNENDQKPQQHEQYLTKDQSQVVEFYRNSLIQKMFSIEKAELQNDFYKQFVVDMLNSYNFAQNDNKQSPKSKRADTTNACIEQTLLKIIYKDDTTKPLNYSDAKLQQTAIPYHALLNRCNNILQHIRKHLFPVEYHHQKGNFSSFLQFIITLYEKIMIAHKTFVDNKMASMMEYDGRNSFSQKAAKVESINVQTEKSFQVLYRINITVICILADLYDVPEASWNAEGKLGSFNTLLTLHQVAFNQLNFPNNFSIFENSNEKENSSSNLKATASYSEYFKGLSHLNILLLKAHQNTYKGLQLCMLHQHSTPKPTQKMIKVQSLASQQKKSQQYEQHEEFVLSYQNIIIQSLDEVSSELEDCFFIYFEKNQQYLMDPQSERFAYFKQISQNILNYIQCLMMIIYRKNHGISENSSKKEPGVPLKNNVMTSLKVVKVLEKVLVLFWEQFWEFETWYDEEDSQEIAGKQQMLAYVQETIGGLLKLLQKFAIPKDGDTLDYRCLKSVLIMAPLLQCYETRGRQVASNDKLISHLHKSKPFIKVLFQITQRLSLPELMKAQASSNLQTRAKLNEQVLGKIIDIFSLDSSKEISALIVNHHFSLVIETLFDNFSRMKEKFQDKNLACIGEERFAIHMIGKLLRQVNKYITSSYNNTNPTSFLLQQKQLQKLTVILQMYLTPQNYTIEFQEGGQFQAVVVVQRISEIQSGAEKVLYEMVNYLAFAGLFKGAVYQQIIKMVMESKFLRAGYLVFMRENVMHVKEIMNLVEQQHTTSQRFINLYIQLCIDIYTKIMSIFTLSYTPHDNSQQTTTTLILASSIFHQLLHFPHFPKHTTIPQLISLQRIRKSLSTNRIFNTFELQVVMMEYLSQNKGMIDEHISMVVDLLQGVYDEVKRLEGVRMTGENYWFVNKMVTDFCGNQFVGDLYQVWGRLVERASQRDVQQIEELCPSKFLSSINSSFINLSKTFSQSISFHKLTTSNLSVLDTPTFNPDNPFGSRKDGFLQEKITKKLSSFGIELNEQNCEQQCELSRNISRGYALNPTQQEQKQASSRDFEQKDQANNGENCEDKESQQQENGKNFIVSELEIPQGDQGNDQRQKNEQNRSAGQISEQKHGENIAFVDESYFACSKIDAVKLFQQFYFNLFNQINTITSLENSGQKMKTQLSLIYEGFKELVQKILVMHINGISQLSFNEAENLALIKSHFKLIQAFEKFYGENKIKQREGSNHTAQNETLAKLYQLYLIKTQLIHDQELREILETYNHSSKKPQTNDNANTYSEKSISSQQEQASPRDHHHQKCTKQTAQKTLLRQLDQLKQSLTQSDSEPSFTTAKHHFESFKEQLINFILTEYSAALFTQKHERKNSFYFVQEKPQSSSLSQLFEAIGDVLKAICEREKMPEREVELYEMIYRSLEDALVECMDLTQVTKTIKSIFRLNLQFNKRKTEL